MIRAIDLTDPAETRRLLELQRVSYRVEAELIGFDGIPGLHDTAASIRNCGETFFGWFESEQLAGAVSYKTDSGVVDIHRLVVDPGHFRRGIGERLIRHVLRTLADGTDKFLVATGTANDPAKRLYLKLGFVRIRDFEAEPNVWITEYERSANRMS
ncbi:GNAT family N-acetyltransferase [Paenibacillus sacheonensis]|uniref:GNAT family N-acetyltransferase n=1 Tax=Paenibacillus sacheonensis TaxID=742054 RepID=A0A7X4YJM2_9BACL|nr:GNAT family N-acetyltransferase [Paenibacillus sacheonensis]MBM7564174.1 ribosomal protein S18 acetylase RimI-like enzyme [Paenibacillus sacheonensis]NBC67498.1 GNAT family N-acetyltransferase [Paenibacillus sacheonensis]